MKVVDLDDDKKIKDFENIKRDKQKYNKPYKQNNFSYSERENLLIQ